MHPHALVGLQSNVPLEHAHAGPSLSPALPASSNDTQSLVSTPSSSHQWPVPPQAAQATTSVTTSVELEERLLALKQDLLACKATFLPNMLTLVPRARHRVWGHDRARQEQDPGQGKVSEAPLLISDRF